MFIILPSPICDAVCQAHAGHACICYSTTISLYNSTGRLAEDIEEFVILSKPRLLGLVLKARVFA